MMVFVTWSTSPRVRHGPSGEYESMYNGILEYSQAIHVTYPLKDKNSGVLFSQIPAITAETIPFEPKK